MRGLGKYLLLVVMMVTAVEGLGKSYYNSVRNGFGGLFQQPGMMMQGRNKAIDKDRLVEENMTMSTVVTLDTMHIGSTSYRYQLRFANLNNKQGKTVTVSQRQSQKKAKLTTTQWGLVFNHDENGDYCAVVLTCENSTPYDDITDQRAMLISVIQHSGDNTTELARSTVDRGVSLEDEMNTLCVDVDERSVHVSIGKNELQQIIEAQVRRPAGKVLVGYLVGAGARVAIERAVLTIGNENQVDNIPQWTSDALDEHFAASSDPNEGYWQYMDRDMEEKWLRLGGRYTLATVRADDGYDIIYIAGAQVGKSQWRVGMIKGHMTRTVFTGNYDLRWIDATMEPIDNDAYATIENGVILSLNFPIFKSQVRFAKVMEIE